MQEARLNGLELVARVETARRLNRESLQAVADGLDPRQGAQGRMQEGQLYQIIYLAQSIQRSYLRESDLDHLETTDEVGVMLGYRLHVKQK